MRLGVNAVRLTRPFTGIGRYLECVLDQWSRMHLPFERVTLYTPRAIDPSRVIFPLERFEQVVGGPGGPDPYWEARFLTARAGEMDVLFAPSYTLPLAYPGAAVVVNHGPAQNRPLSYHWWRAGAYERLYRYSARRADRVLACSKAVKRRIVAVYGIPASKVTVLWNAASRLFAPVRDAAALARVRQRYVGSDGPFALFVGKLARRHAIPELIRAFAWARARAPRHRLVIVGPDYLGLDLPRLARREGIADAVVHHPFVEHRELPALYSAAEEMVFPVTHAEGFGLPVIEAMACGTPVLSVAQGAVPEFATGAALLVPSSSAEDLAVGLEQLISDVTLRQELSEQGPRRAATITWQFTAERTLEELVAVARARATGAA
jgi:glycosyltransferase involved in cell wall biosynthesis